MKRTVSVFILLIVISFGVSASDSPWPALSPETWGTMSVEQLSELLRANDVNARTEMGMTALMMAVRSNENAEIVDLLIAEGAYVNARTEMGMTALMFASGNESSDVFDSLISAGADVNARTRFITVLSAAATINNNHEVIERLISAGADVNEKTEYNLTALMQAASNIRNPEVINRLLDAGADATVQTTTGSTAWDIIQDNEALKGTDAYWRLNDLRFE